MPTKPTTNKGRIEHNAIKNIKVGTNTTDQIRKRLKHSRTKDNIIDRDQLQDDYINRVIDGLDIKDLIALVYDQLDHNLDSYSCEELIEEVNEHYPDFWSRMM